MPPGRTPLNCPEPIPSICAWPASIIMPVCCGVIGNMLPYMKGDAIGFMNMLFV